MKFPWTKEPEVVPEPVRDERLDDPEWVPLSDRSPNRPDLPVFIISKFRNPFVGYVNELNFYSHIIYWKPTAIYREVSGESL